MTDLTEDERWIITENLIESELGLREIGEDETADEVADLLDKLSPNWRTADSCVDVETRPMSVDAEMKSDE